MRMFYHFLGDILREPPPDALERLAPWVIALLGSLILALVAYAWWTASSTL